MRDDPIQNLKIVQLVEKYPLLYDSSMKEYDMKQEVEKAWSAIGSELRMTANHARDRWRVIRGSYVRYMRQQNSSDGESPKKPYYLANYMKFVNPFLKLRESYPMVSESKRGILTRKLTTPREKKTCVIRLKRRRSSGESADQTSKPVAEDSSISIIEPYFEDGENNTEETEKHQQRDVKHVELYNIAESSSSSHRYTVIQAESKNDEPAKSPANTEVQWQKMEVAEDTADLHFFKSLLPEMANLTPSNKNKFKIEVLNALNHLLYGE
ncbi:uncharacterized protein LOC129802249 [Phlebotomus papatasi]|uniref:MADF domain-containing protein n=1 Tax=Phlebotomus papatasi TaxID=29031 RepID=A0A1B0CYT4_PHLPP|nr:uncharacterized protein LOC129802249 [Phlebotomus papatasi]